MPYLIPDDWSTNDGYACIKLYWPDSSQWMAILRGVLTEMARGRIWDEQTGSVIDTQVIGGGIFIRTYPFKACDDCGDAGAGGDENISAQHGYGCCAESEDSDMGCNCPEPSIKIENGVLYVWHCCEWVTVGSVGDTVGSVPDDPLNPGGDPEFEYSACGKATAIVNMVYAIVDACYDQLPEYPWKWIPNIEATVGYDLDNKWLLLEMSALAAFDLLGFGSDELFSDLEKARIICNVEPLLSEDASGVTQEIYEQIKSVFAGEFYQDLLARGEFFRNALNALGWKDMNTVAMLGAGDTTAVCDCPGVDPIVPPAGMDWCYDFDFEDGQQGFTSDEGSYEAGVGFKGTTNYFSTGSRVQFSRDNDVGDACVIKFLGIVYDVPSGSSGEGESDLVRACGSIISEADIELSLGDDQVYIRQSDTVIASSTSDFGVDFSMVSTSNLPIVVKRLVVCGTGDDPLDGA